MRDIEGKVLKNQECFVIISFNYDVSMIVFKCSFYSMKNCPELVVKRRVVRDDPSREFQELTMPIPLVLPFMKGMKVDAP